jgi:hypothetical protein
MIGHERKEHCAQESSDRDHDGRASGGKLMEGSILRLTGAR